jgi:hypothetical protein
MQLASLLVYSVQFDLIISLQMFLYEIGLLTFNVNFDNILLSITTNHDLMRTLPSNKV